MPFQCFDCIWIHGFSILIGIFVTENIMRYISFFTFFTLLLCQMPIPIQQKQLQFLSRIRRQKSVHENLDEIDP